MWYGPDETSCSTITVGCSNDVGNSYGCYFYYNNKGKQFHIVHPFTLKVVIHESTMTLVDCSPWLWKQVMTLLLFFLKLIKSLILELPCLVVLVTTVLMPLILNHDSESSGPIIY